MFTAKEFASLIPTLMLLLVGGVLDKKTGHIPNWLTMPALLLGLAVGLFDGRGLDHLLGFGVATLVCLAAYRAALAGGGSVRG